jgi:hypothetical protein
MIIVGCAGFTIHRSEDSGFDYKISSQSGIFTAELTTFLVVGMGYVGFLIDNYYFSFGKSTDLKKKHADYYFYV